MTMTQLVTPRLSKSTVRQSLRKSIGEMSLVSLNWLDFLLDIVTQMSLCDGAPVSGWRVMRELSGGQTVKWISTLWRQRAILDPKGLVFVICSRRIGANSSV
jgi:hypothetical protein